MNYTVLFHGAAVHNGTTKREAVRVYLDMKDQSKETREPVQLLEDGKTVREYLPAPKLPGVAELAALLRSLKPQIEDDFRASDDADDDTPAMSVTIGARPSGSWGYQTGDNSFTGGAYGFPHWSVVTLYRRSNCTELARDIRAELADLMAQ